MSLHSLDALELLLFKALTIPLWLKWKNGKSVFYVKKIVACTFVWCVVAVHRGENRSDPKVQRSFIED